MPEKFNAPEGNIYHDIRPQGFAMGAWLAAWSSLGLKRLPYGLALRPTRAFEEIRNYAWRGMSLDFHYGADGQRLALDVDGVRIEETLQVPENRLKDRACIRLIESGSIPLWLRSSVRLNDVHIKPGKGSVVYEFESFGLSHIGFTRDPGKVTLRDDKDTPVPFQIQSECGIFSIHFAHFGRGRLIAG